MKDCNVTNIARQALEKLQPGFVKGRLSMRREDGAILYCSRGAIMSVVYGVDDLDVDLDDVLSPGMWPCVNAVEEALGFEEFGEDTIVDWNNNPERTHDEILERFSSLL